ncbi:hypothetical protein K438DRAFT_1021571 [Mycena galopus ATCC 62051]|nr:hypothetical protein K438DRAFT_1021571 [Mycena galopus ATCC 62051]
MASDPFSVRAVVLEQTERTRRSSKADIERLIQQSESKIATFESQISALESQATALLEQRDRESACVAALRYIVSPIHALAAELLAEIFEHAIHDDTHVEDVFRVSQVCSDWRQVAHSTPRLWTGPIRLEWFQESQMGDHVAVEGLKAWLARSASLPVSIEYMQPG